MFITLKNSKRNTPRLEEVAQRSATLKAASGRDSKIRTPPCSACQVQKLRCTGDSSTCDRCSAQSIVCIASRPRRRSASPPTAPKPRQLARHDTQTPPREASAVSHTFSSCEARNPSEETISASPCTCLQDMASVVQKLDDDEFHLTTLPLDKVLQLQKWLVFQCCRPLECQKCNNSPPVHTLLLIVCDRLTEMFDCTSRRLKRIRVTTTGGMAMQALSDVLGGKGPSKDPAEPFKQLFCSVSGSPADQTECTPVIFSDDLHGQYTEEEQVHMIRGIITFHVGYFRRLLLRIEDLSQAGGNKARLSRISFIIARLDAAAAAIELAFQGILAGERVES